MNPVDHFEQFMEVEELMDFLLKQEIVTPEDIEMSVVKFRTIFLTIENKEDFLPFLNSYLMKIEGNDEYNEEKVEALKTELESFYDRMATNFSIYHIAGYKDPNNDERSEQLSDDINDSFDNNFMNTKMNQNLFGPEIPEKQKPIVIKVLEKISSLYDQKMTNRTQMISLWRFLRLANQIKKLKKQSPAINTISKHIFKKYHYFYQLKSLIEDQKEVVDNSELIKKYEDKIKELLMQIKFLEQNQQQGQSIDEETLKYYEDLENRLKDKDNQINQLNSDLDKIKQENENFLLSSSQDKEKRAQALKDLIEQLKKKNQNLELDKENQQNQIQDIEDDLKKRFKTIEDMKKELEALRRSNNVNNLSSFGKIRYFMKAMNHFTMNLKGIGFLKIFKRKEKAKMALQNVTDRIKARLLIQTRQLNCGQDIRRSFLKWMIKANPDLLRDLVSKVCLTAKINTQVALWRMKKIAFKPIIQKLPEAVKTMRRLKGFFILTNLYGDHDYKNKKFCMDLMNPNHKSKNQNLLEKIFLQKYPQRLMRLKSDLLNKLRDNKDRQKKLIQKLVDKNQELLRSVFAKLRDKKNQARSLNDLVQLSRVFSKMHENYRESALKFFNKFKDSDSKSKMLLNKMLNSQVNKMRRIFEQLKEHKNDKTRNEMKENYKFDLKKNQKLAILRQLMQNQKDKLRQYYEQLKNHKNEANRKNDLNNHLKKQLMNMIEKQNKNRMLQVYEKLKQNYEQSQKEQQQTAIALDYMDQRTSQKLHNALKALRQNNQKESLKEKLKKINQSKILKQIFQNLYFKKKEIFDRLRNNNETLKGNQQKGLNQMKSFLSKNDLNSLKDCLKKLRMNKQEKQDKDKLNKLKNLISQKLKSSSEQKLASIFADLIKNKNNKQNEERRLKKRQLQILNSLLKGSKFKKQCALKLLQLNNNEENQKAEKLQNRKLQILKKLSFNMHAKKRRMFTNLLSSNLTKKEDLKLNTVKKMMNQQQNKMKEIFNILRNNKKDEQNKEKLKNAKLQKLLNNLKLSSNVKLLQTFQELKNNQKDKDKEDSFTVNYIRNILKRLSMTQKQKLSTIFNKLINNTKREDYEARLKKKKLMQFLLRLKNNQLKRNKCFRDLLEYARDEKREQIQLSDDKKNKLTKLFAKFMLRNMLKKRKCFNSLQKNCNDEQQKELQRSKVLLNMFNNMKLNNINQNRRILDKLRKHNKDKKKIMKQCFLKLWIKNQRKQQHALNALINNKKDEKQTESIKKKILLKLNNSEKGKLKNILNLLRQNNNESNREEKNASNSKKHLLNKLNVQSENKLKEILRMLRHNNIVKSGVEQQKKIKLNNIFQKLKRKNDNKLRSCLNNLIENREEDLQNRKRINKMFDKLFSSKQNKLKNCFAKMRQFGKEQTELHNNKLKLLNRQLQKEKKQTLLKYFKKLIEHYLKQLLHENKVKNTISRMDVIKKFDSFKCMNELKKNLHKKLLEDKLKKDLIIKLVSSMKKKQQDCNKNLKDFKNKKNQNIKLSARLVRDKILKDVQHFMRKLKMHNYLIKRNKLSTRLNNMVYCIKKNHKTIQRDALHIWANSEYKNKVKQLNGLLEKLMLKRQFESYIQIKRNYLAKKYEKMIKGLMMIMKMTENKEYDLKKETLKVMIEKFVDRNPWFKKVIQIMAVLSKPNHQISFWRMRYAKNLKKSGLSAEQSIKLKKLFHTVNLKVQKHLSHSFWKINSYADTKKQIIIIQYYLTQGLSIDLSA